MPSVVTLTCNPGTWKGRISWVQVYILSSRPTWTTKSDLISKDQNLPGVVTHTFNSSTQEAEAEIGWFLWVQSCLVYICVSRSERFTQWDYLKKKKKKSWTIPQWFVLPLGMNLTKFKPELRGAIMWTLSSSLKACSPIHNTLCSLKLYTGCFTLSPGFWHSFLRYNNLGQ